MRAEAVLEADTEQTADQLRNSAAGVEEKTAPRLSDFD
jgi:hypothetical protein